jgi:hypothetical protein
MLSEQSDVLFRLAVRLQQSHGHSIQKALIEEQTARLPLLVSSAVRHALDVLKVHFDDG